MRRLATRAHLTQERSMKYYSSTSIDRRDDGKRSNEAVVREVDLRGESGYRMGLAFAAAGKCGATFQGSSSSMRLAGCPAMCSST